MTNHIPTELLASSGVYIIRNSINAKVYVGSAVNFKRRHKNHLNDLKRGVHHSALLQRFANKYGIETLRFELLATCEPAARLAIEQTFIVMYRAANPAHGFNICPVAGSSLGVKPSEETREKLRQRRQGYKHSEETKAKIRESNKGKNIKPVSSETRAKLSKAGIGRVFTADTRAKLSAALTGRIFSEQWKANIGAATSKRTHTEATKAKISATLLKKYAA